MQLKQIVLTTFLAILCIPTAFADAGMGLRLGTLGYGADLDVQIAKKLNLRLGYNNFHLSGSFRETNVRYGSEFEINAFSLLADWYIVRNILHVTGGLYNAGPTMAITASATNGSYVIGGHSYSNTQVSSLRGEIKMGNKVLPYVGVGVGNVVNKKHHISFLADIGLIIGSKIKVSLDAQCGAGASAATCSQLQQDAAKENDDVSTKFKSFSTYPVINVGLGIRF